MRTILLLALAVASGAALAQDAPDLRRPPLFVLSDADSRVVLLGSIHLLPAGALPLPPAVEAAYADADVVAFEIDLDAAQAEAPAAMAQGFGETSVAEALNADQKAAFDAAVAALSLPAGALDAVEPWLAALTLSALAVQAGSARTEDGVDAVLYGRAKTDGKERVALETMALQLDAFDGLDTADQVAFLMASVGTGLDATQAAFAEMYTAWASGDDDALAGLLATGFDATPAAAEALLANRNRAWVPQIEALLARDGQDALVVVGAGHLVGPGSVVELLREAGYRVERR